MEKSKRIFSLALTLAMVFSMLAVIQTPASANVLPQNPPLSRQAAAEGMVLLENDGTLPLKTGARVALFGRTQITFVKGGTGSGETVVPYTVNLLQGMQSKQAEEKLTLAPGLVSAYTAWVSANPGNANNKSNPEMALSDEVVSAARAASDVAVVIIGRNAGEGSDRTNTKGDYLLKDDETAMLTKVCAAFDKVVVVLNIGGIIDMKWLADYPSVKSVLLAWQPGMEGGNAVADVLCGDVNPSGKLTDTIAFNYADYPSSSNFGTSSKVTYVEDIYNGYRYFSTADPTFSKVKYDFGYGKSYTTFEVSSGGLVKTGDNFTITNGVKNTGTVPGREVLQIYCEAPAGLLNKPGAVLVGFAKTKLLAPGETEYLDIRFSAKDFASYDDMGKTGHKSAWVVEPGTYRFLVGTSIKSAMARSKVYSTTYNELKVLDQLTEQLRPIASFDRLVNPVTGAKEPLFTVPPIEVSATEATNFDVTAISSATSAAKLELVPGTQQRCLAFFNNAEEVTFKLNVAQAGAYDLSFRYALGRASIANAFDCYINDVKQPITVAMAQTGDGDGKAEWYNFTDSAVYRIALPAGAVTMKWVSKSSAGNISTIKLAPAPAVVTALSLASPAMVSAGVASATAESIFPKAPMQLLEVYKDPSKMDAFIASMSVEDLAYLSQGHGATIGSGTGTIGNYPKYGISPVDTADGPAGLRISSQATAWPVSTLLACTWDVDLLEKIGEAVGDEALASSVDVWLAPGMNIHRNPLCGRNFEYFSEDPLLTGKMATAITKGVQSKGIGVTLKHYAANNQETNRNGVDTIVSERALREIYLRGFEIAVREAKPWCVMTSYNYINGFETSERYDLVTTVLRDEWGFDGLVMTDWSNDSTHWKEAIAGNDVKMPSGNTSNLTAAISSGTLQRWELERNVKRVLELVMRSKKFESVIANPDIYAPVITKILGEGVTRMEAETAAETTGAPRTESCSDTGGGLNMGYMDAGGTITYYVDVEKTGYYNLTFRYAANASPYGRYTIYVDGAEAAKQAVFTSTGGWQNWRTSAPVAVPLTKGEHFFKITITGGGSNLNWMDFEWVAPIPAKITSAACTSPIISGYNAVVRFDIKGVSLEGKTITGTLLGKEFTFDEDGVALVRLTKAEVPYVTGDALFPYVLYIGGVEAWGSDILIKPKNVNLWTVNVRFAENKEPEVIFNSAISPSPKGGYGATVNGKAVPVEQAGEYTLRIKTTDYHESSDNVMIVSGVKYAELFPSYSFSFTVHF